MAAGMLGYAGPALEDADDVREARWVTWKASKEIARKVADKVAKGERRRQRGVLIPLEDARKLLSVVAVEETFNG